MKHTKKDTPAIEIYNQFDIQQTIQSIWQEKDLSKKKRRTIDEVIKNFKFKEKQLAFIGKIKTCKTSQEVDKILTNIVLYDEGLNTIKI